MSTRKAALVVFLLRVRHVSVFFALPMRCLAEITEGFSDILCLFGRVAVKPWTALSMADDALAMVGRYGPLDLLEVEAGAKPDRVKIRFLLR